MNNPIKLTELRRMLCPFVSPPQGATMSLCMGTACMAWRWAIAPMTEFVATLDGAVALHIGLLDREGLALPVEGSAAAWDTFYTAFAKATVHSSDFSLAIAGGVWTPIGRPEYDEEAGQWHQKFERNNDPRAAGYCGMVPTPPAQHCSH